MKAFSCGISGITKGHQRKYKESPGLLEVVVSIFEEKLETFFVYLSEFCSLSLLKLSHLDILKWPCQGPN